MKIIGDIFLIAYVLAWWLAFWLPAKKGVGSPIAFIPAAICAFGVPMLTSDYLRGTPHGFLLFWAVLPFVVVVGKVLWRIKKRNSNHTSDIVAKRAKTSR